MGTSSFVLILGAVLMHAVHAAYFCTPPKSLQYGGYLPLQRSYKVGQTIEFSCEKGYILVGKSWTVCVADYRKKVTGWAHPSPTCKPISCPDLDDIQYGSLKLSGKTPTHTAVYTCNKGYKLTGVSKRICLYSGVWDGQAPSCKPIYCPNHLPSPQYGSVVLSGYSPSHSAVYACDKGYKLAGASKRICTYSGVWDGEAPTCEPIYCPDLDDVQYGSVKLSGKRPTHIAVYTCNKGYKLVGATKRTCLYHEIWNGEAPKCKPIYCPDLDGIQYGSVKLSGKRPTHTAVYTCSKGYKLVGGSKRTCLYHGIWDGEAPKCEPIYCPDLDDIQYGSVKLSGKRPTHTALYVCNKGYKLVGLSKRTCLYHGVWDGEIPRCEPIYCPDLDGIQYGSVKLSGKRPTHTAVYTCNKGYKLVGLSMRTCLYHGIWDGKAPICESIYCPDLDGIQYGSVTLSGKRPTHTAIYACNKGYKLVGSPKRTCLYDGIWDGKAPTCERIYCPDLDGIQYGSVKLSGKRPTHTAVYTCNKGYKLVGKPKRTCLYHGIWDGKAPTCEIIYCPEPHDIQYGSVKPYGRKSTHTIVYTCNKGYKLVGPSKRTCLYYGIWDGKAPRCEPIYCPDLDGIQYGSVKLSGKRPTHTAVYTCIKGYKLVGASKRTCLYHGVWDGKAPTCELIYCPNLDDIQYGSVKSSGRRPTHTALYTCNKGYKLVGSSKRTCLYHGIWDVEAPRCEPIYCPDLDDFQYGSVKLSGRRPTHTAVYTCIKGYKLVGASKRTCLYHGVWDGKAPTCELPHCPILDDIQHGSVKLSGRRPTHTAVYTCNKGYKLVGASKRTCLYHKIWDGKAPRCEPIYCPVLDDFQYGSVKLSGRTPTHTAVYTCNKGYKLVGESKRTCLYHGIWDGDLPKCEPIYCPDLDDIQYGSVKLSGKRPTHIAVYSCNKGYKLVGALKRTCQYQGIWNGEAPKCILITCPPLENPQYGEVKVSGNTPGHKAVYECEKGYVRKGLPLRKCLYNGRWAASAPTCRPVVDCGKPSIDNGKVKFTGTTENYIAYYSCQQGYILKGNRYRKCLATGQWSGPSSLCVREKY